MIHKKELLKGLWVVIRTVVSGGMLSYMLSIRNSKNNVGKCSGF